MWKKEKLSLCGQMNVYIAEELRVWYSSISLSGRDIDKLMLHFVVFLSPPMSPPFGFVF